MSQQDKQESFHIHDEGLKPNWKRIRGNAFTENRSETYLQNNIRISNFID